MRKTGSGLGSQPSKPLKNGRETARCVDKSCGLKVMMP
nr:MAG TPA: hypothetical protein [Caudoviricetes sp.]DAT01292.1 MAG TPA: hypothetical protein [Caudoviricetes sp.]